MYLTSDCRNFGWWMDWLDALSVSTQAYSYGCSVGELDPAKTKVSGTAKKTLRLLFKSYYNNMH